MRAGLPPIHVTVKKFYIELFGCAVACVGVTSSIGILAHIPFLVNWGFTYNMALPTAVCFVLVGWAIYALAEKGNE